MKLEPRLLLLLAATTGLAACSAGVDRAALPARDHEGTKAAGVRLVQPVARLETIGLQVSGQLRARNEATLSAPATGQVSEVLVDVGDRVKRKQPLVKIDTSNMVIAVSQARAARAMAEAAYKSAARELERTRQLRESGGTPEAQLDRMQAGHDQALAAFEQAKAAQRMAEEMLRDHTLVAPFDGVVTARFVKLGETVATMPPTPMITVVDTSRLEIRLPVPEALANSVEPGARLAGTVNPGGERFEASVRTVGAVVDLQSRTVEVLADVTPGGPTLRPGSLVEVALIPEETAGVYVPSASVQRDGERLFVWVAESEKAVRREVEAIQASAQYFHVRAGLGVDDRVVRDGAAGLSEGAVLRVLE